MVNRDKVSDVTASLSLPCTSARAIFVDVYHGFILDQTDSCDGLWSLKVDLEASGYGAVLMTEEVEEEELIFIDLMAEMTRNPLSSYNDDWVPLTQTLETNLADDNMADSGIQLEDLVFVEGGIFNFFVIGSILRAMILFVIELRTS